MEKRRGENNKRKGEGEGGCGLLEGGCGEIGETTNHNLRHLSIDGGPAVGERGERCEGERQRQTQGVGMQCVNRTTKIRMIYNREREREREV